MKYWSQALNNNSTFQELGKKQILKMAQLRSAVPILVPRHQGQSHWKPCSVTLTTFKDTLLL